MLSVDKRQFKFRNLKNLEKRVDPKKIPRISRKFADDGSLNAIGKVHVKEDYKEQNVTSFSGTN